MQPAEATGIREEDPPSAVLLAREEIERAKDLRPGAKSARTRHEHDRDWADFEDYCRARGLGALPAEPQTVARYVAALAPRLTIATIRRRAVAISQRHQQHWFETPTAHKLVRDVMAGIANTHGTAPHQKTALTLDLLRLALFGVGGSELKIARDRDGPSLRCDAARLGAAGHALRRCTTADRNGPEMIGAAVPWRRF